MFCWLEMCSRILSRHVNPSSWNICFCNHLNLNRPRKRDIRKIGSQEVQVLSNASYLG